VREQLDHGLNAETVQCAGHSNTLQGCGEVHSPLATSQLDGHALPSFEALTTMWLMTFCVPLLPHECEHEVAGNGTLSSQSIGHVSQADGGAGTAANFVISPPVKTSQPCAEINSIVLFTVSAWAMHSTYSAI
jgi:hypothetical protein